MAGPGPPAVGAQRRLRALAARSWSPLVLQRETGIPALLISPVLGKCDDITLGLAYAVKDGYERLWDQEPVHGTDAERQAANEDAVCAARRGWAPPQAWDET